MKTLFPRTLAGAAAIMAAACPVHAQQAASPPPAPVLEFAFEEIVTLAADIPVGRTALGERNIVPITGGTFEGPGEGPGIRGTIIPGGWDWQLRRPDGCTQIKADYMLRTDDGVVINVVNSGVLCRSADGALVPARTTPVFEVPVGKYDWLGKSAFIGTLEPVKLPSGPAVKIRFYRAR